MSDHNPQYARGMAFAAAQEASNVRSNFASLLRAFPAIERDCYVNTPASFDRYTRAYHELRRAAERCADLGDQNVSIPVPLPEKPAAKMIKVTALPEYANYKETGGRDKNGDGVPAQSILNNALSWCQSYIPGRSKANQ